MGKHAWLLRFVAAIAAIAAVASGRECAADVRELKCGNFSGIIFARDGGEAEYVKNLTGWRPLSVPAWSELSISACDIGNHRLHDVTLRNVSLVPSLVGDVGPRARVRVAVRHSANLDVSGRLVLGSVLPEGRVRRRRLRRQMRRPDTAIVSSLVDGVVHSDAHVAVSLSDTANVWLRGGTRDMHVGRATLLGELINAHLPRAAACVEYVCISIDVRNAANVRGADGKTGVYIRDGQLDDETLDAGCLGRDAYINVTKTAVANVENVGALHIYDGELSDEALDVHNLQGALIRARLRDVGNVYGARDVRIVDGELVDEIIDAKHVLNSLVQVDAANVGNVKAKSLFVREGELVDEAIDTGVLFESDIKVAFDNVGNVQVMDDVTIYEGELVDEAVDALYVRQTHINIKMGKVGNVRAGNVTIRGGELVDEVLDVFQVTGGSARVSLTDVANVFARDTLRIANGELLDETFDVGLVKDAKIEVSLTKSGNADAKKVYIRGGELVDEALDSKSLTRGSLRISLDDVGNVRCRKGATLSIVNGQLLDNVADVWGRVDVPKAKMILKNSGQVHLPKKSVSITNGTLAKSAVYVRYGEPGIEVTTLKGELVRC